MPSVIENIALFANSFVQVMSAVLVVVLLIRLASQDLFRPYLLWSAFLVVEAIAALSLVLLPLEWHFPVFAVAETVKVGLSIALFLKLCRSVFVRYPALGQAASRASRYFFPLCALLAGFSFLLDPALPPGRSPVLHLAISVDRALTTALLLVSFAMGIFAGWFPVQMKKNTARFLIGFMSLLAASWIDLLVSNSAPRLTNVGNVFYGLVQLTAVVYWAIALDRAGEEAVSSTVPEWNPEKMEQMSAQLNQMQAQLSRRGY